MLCGVLGVGGGRLGRCEGRVGGRARSQPVEEVYLTHAADSMNDQIVIQSILTHEFDGQAQMAQRRWPSADSDLMRYELILIEIRVVSH